MKRTEHVGVCGRVYVGECMCATVAVAVYLVLSYNFHSGSRSSAVG